VDKLWKVVDKLHALPICHRTATQRIAGNGIVRRKIQLWNRVRNRSHYRGWYFKSKIGIVDVRYVMLDRPKSHSTLQA